MISINIDFNQPIVETQRLAGHTKLTSTIQPELFTTTRDGRNALDLFDSGVLEGFGVNHSQVELDEFRTVLVDHLAFDDDDDELDRSGEFRLDVPGAFPDVSC